MCDFRTDAAATPRSQSAEALLKKNDVFSGIWFSIFEKAFCERTSDIHVESFSGLIRIRFRKNGELVIAREFSDADLIDQLMVRLKEISGLDVSIPHLKDSL